jgi:predicted dehydrogenase
MQALEAARNVVVDKPMGISSAEIAQMMELAGGLGLLLVPFHSRRFDSDFQTIQKLLHEGNLGHVVHFDSCLDRWRPGATRRPWKDDPAQGGGILLDLGTHLLDQALSQFGLPESVSAEVLREREGEGANDSFTVRLGYFTRFAVTLSANLLSALPRPRFHLRGTQGNFVKFGIDPQEEALAKITRITDPNWGQEPSAAWGTLSVDVDGGMVTRPVEPVPGDYRLFYTGVRDALLGTVPVPVESAAAWRVARLLEWAIESAEKHRDIECDWSSEPV